ncbi:hypothetical protein COCON_G00122740, partial [Conger conger]
CNATEQCCALYYRQTKVLIHITFRCLLTEAVLRPHYCTARLNSRGNLFYLPTYQLPGLLSPSFVKDPGMLSRLLRGGIRQRIRSHVFLTDFRRS